MIKDGRRNRVLNKKIDSKIYVSLFHGNKDDTVPTKYSKKLIKIFIKAEKKLIIIKNGDHSLFAKSYKKRILAELNNMINKTN